MKSNKGIVTILGNLTQFILQQRINYSQQTAKHVESLNQELSLLKDQLMPSMEILHFLVDRHSFNIKHKITQELKNLPLESMTVKIKFTIHDKITSVTHMAQLWKLTVNTKTHKDVSPESTSHELLFLLSQVLRQLTTGTFLNQLIRNHEVARKFIIDFQIKIAETQKEKNCSFCGLNQTWINHAAIDNSRELVLSCHSNTNLSQLLSITKKSLYFSQSFKTNKNKGGSQCTRRSSTDSDGQPRRFRSQDDSHALFEIYDSELDVTIISSESEEHSGNHIINEVNYQQEESEFQLLIEERNKDSEFLKQNEHLLSEWENTLTTAF